MANEIPPAIIGVRLRRRVEQTTRTITGMALKTSCKVLLRPAQQGC